MMKLMKFLVVALVAGGVCAPALSQAGEVDGKAVMCDFTIAGRFPLNCDSCPYLPEEIAQGFHLTAYHFEGGGVHRITIGRPLEDGPFSPRTIERELIKSLNGQPAKYRTSPGKIHWGSWISLDRKTLVLSGLVTLAHCELIHPNEIDTYFQPYVDYSDDFGKARDEKAREGNKL